MLKRTRLSTIFDYPDDLPWHSHREWHSSMGGSDVRSHRQRVELYGAVFVRQNSGVCMFDSSQFFFFLG
jgi:hypothetical protein